MRLLYKLKNNITTHQKSKEAIFISPKYSIITSIAFILFALIFCNLPEKYQLANLINNANMETPQRGVSTGNQNQSQSQTTNQGLMNQTPTTSISTSGQSMVLAETIVNDRVAFAKATADQSKKTLQMAGSLTDKNGKPVEGTFNIRFAIYTKNRTILDPAPSDTDQNQRIWEETRDITFKNGTFQVELGEKTDLPTINENSNQLFIGMKVNTDSEMVPRKKISTPLFSFNAGNSITLNGKKIGTNSGDILTLNESGQININNLPIGTNNDQLVLGNDKRLKYTITGSSFISLSGQAFKINKINLNNDIQNTLAISNGGTGLTSYTAGDLFYYTSGDSLTKLPIGTTGKILTVENGLPLWKALSAGSIDINSIDFLELKNNLTMDSNLTIDATANNYSLNIDNNTLFINTQDNRIGIGVSNPQTTLDVNGTIRASSMIINGEATLGTVGQNITFNSSLIPSTSGLNLGSSSSHWANLYVDNMTVGVTDMNGTSSEFFAINTDSTTDENMGIRFYRASLNGYAGLFWNATNQNFNLYKKENTQILADLNVQNFYAGGNVGIGTTSPASLFSVGATSQFQVAGTGSIITGAITAPTSTNSINNLVINAGALSGITTLALNNQITSTIASGTAPMQISSTTKVANLNADLLDGFDSSAFGDATANNQLDILTRIGTNADGSSMSSTLFAGLKYISGQIGSLPIESVVKLGTAYGVNNNGLLTPISGASSTLTATAADVASGKLFFGSLSGTWTPLTGTAVAYTHNEWNGTAGSLVADYAFYTKANGGVDDYNNSGTTPSDAYTAGTWTDCSTGSYCGADSNANKQDPSTGVVWSNWMATGATQTWFWANNCFEPGTAENPGTCVNNGDDACRCVKKSSSKVGCESLGDGLWRLPSQKELMQAYIDGSWGNLSSAGYYYWSATTYSNNTQNAWNVYLSYGYTSNTLKTFSASYRVRCVR